MSGGERPIGAAKGKQTNTRASCPPPPRVFVQLANAKPYPKRLEAKKEELQSLQSTNCPNYWTSDEVCLCPPCPCPCNGGATDRGARLCVMHRTIPR